jgi:radical SAM protein with 4Fe4S-binding SPASM domain
MEIKDYADWSGKVHQRLVPRRVPLNGAIEITRRCNNRCVHCYNNLAANDPDALQRELSCTAYCSIIDQIAQAGCLWLLLTGGEVFLRDDFLDIYTYAKQSGLLISLFTNGTLITPAIVDHLDKWRPFSIEITLYGHTRETYERITGVAGSFERCMRGIRLLMERRLPLKLKTMAITLNTHEIPELKQFVEDELGLDFKFDALINPRCDFSQRPLNVRLTPAEVVALDLNDASRAEEWKKFCQTFNKNRLRGNQAQKLWQCGGGAFSFAIDPYGMLRMCMLSRGHAYDLRGGCFEDGWKNYLYQLRQTGISRKSKCDACEIRSMCGMCPANAELECLDAETPVDFLCRVAHLRAYCFGIDIAPHGQCAYCKEGKGYVEMMETVEKIMWNAECGMRKSDGGMQKKEFGIGNAEVGDR